MFYTVKRISLCLLLLSFSTLTYAQGVEEGGGQTDDIDDVAIGNTATNTLSGGTGGNTAVGAFAVAGTSSRNTAIGHAARATGHDASALGGNSGATGERSVSVGWLSRATTTDATALGSGSNANGVNSVAIGNGSTATLSNAQTAAQNNGFSVGDSTYGEQTNATGGQAEFGNRLLTGVADGSVTSGSTQAVNGGQLNAVATEVTENTGDIATNASNISTNTTNITNNTNAIANRLVRQTGTPGAANTADLTVGNNTNGTVVNFANLDGNSRTLTNVNSGALSATSTEAVNGAQLFATNQNVTTNTNNIAAIDTRVTTNRTDIDAIDTRVTTNRTDIDAIDTRVTTNRTDIDNIDTRVTTNRTDIDNIVANQLVNQTGTPGASNTATMTVGANTNGTVVDFGNLDGNARTLTNVRAATLSATSTEAVNGAQLFATNQRVATNTRNIKVNSNNIKVNTKNITSNRIRIEDLESRTANVINNHAEQIDLTKDKVVDHSFQLANHERRLSDVENHAKRNSQGVAMALASAPTYSAADKRGRVNVGVGHFEGETALAASGTYRLKKNRFVYGTLGVSGDATGGAVGMSFGW